MSVKPSTLVVGAVAAAYGLFIVCEFAGLFGGHAGHVSPVMLMMLILLLALFAGDLWRTRDRSEADR